MKNRVNIAAAQAPWASEADYDRAKRRVERWMNNQAPKGGEAPTHIAVKDEAKRTAILQPHQVLSFADAARMRAERNRSRRWR